MTETALGPDEPGRDAAPLDDPTWDGPVSSIDTDVAAFLTDLRDLRARNGAPSYATLARRTGLPRSTVYDGLRRDRLPALDLTAALARALDGDEAAWRQRWTQLRCRLDSPVVASGAGRTISDAPAGPSATPGGGGWQSRGGWRSRRGRRGRWPRWLVAVAVLVAFTVGAGGYLIVRQSGGRCQAGELYTVTSDGDLLDTSRAVIATVSKGQLVLVRSHNHDVYLHRLLGTVQGSGKVGYVDEARLDPVRATCTR